MTTIIDLNHYIGERGISIFGVDYDSKRLQEVRQRSALNRLFVVKIEAESEDIRTISITTLIGDSATATSRFADGPPVSVRSLREKPTAVSASNGTGTGDSSDDNTEES